MDRNTDVLNFKRRNRTIFISIALSIPVFLLAAFLFSTPPPQDIEQTTGNLGASSPYGSIRRLDSMYHNSVTPLLALSTGNVYVVWKDSSNINFRGSENNGESFRGVRNLSNNTGSSESPQIAAAGENVYVVWQDNSSGTNDIYLRGSENNGESFRGVRNLSNNTGSSESPQIAAAGENVYVVWQDNSSGTNDIYLRGSENNGESFRGVRNLSNNTGSSESPQIAAAGENVYVVWKDDTNSSSGSSDIQFRASVTNGSKFRGIRTLSNNTGSSESPQIAAAGENVYVVWKDDTNSSSGSSDIQFRASVTNGSKFRGIRTLSNNTGSSESPQIAAAGENVYVVWKDDTNSSSGSSDIQFRASVTNGSKFRGISNLSNNTGSSEAPQIAAAGENVYVVWQDNSSGTNDISFKGSGSNGVRFTGTRNLSNNTGSSEFPQIGTARDNAYVLWQDDSSGTSGVYLVQVNLPA